MTCIRCTQSPLWVRTRKNTGVNLVYNEGSRAKCGGSSSRILSSPDDISAIWWPPTECHRPTTPSSWLKLLRCLLVLSIMCNRSTRKRVRFVEHEVRLLVNDSSTPPAFIFFLLFFFSLLLTLKIQHFQTLSLLFLSYVSPLTNIHRARLLLLISFR